MGNYCNGLTASVCFYDRVNCRPVCTSANANKKIATKTTATKIWMRQLSRCAIHIKIVFFFFSFTLFLQCAIEIVNRSMLCSEAKQSRTNNNTKIWVIHALFHSLFHHNFLPFAPISIQCNIFILKDQITFNWMQQKSNKIEYQLFMPLVFRCSSQTDESLHVVKST